MNGMLPDTWQKVMTPLVADKRTATSCGQSLTITLGENVCLWMNHPNLGVQESRLPALQLEGTISRLPSAVSLLCVGRPLGEGESGWR